MEEFSEKELNFIVDACLHYNEHLMEIHKKMGYLKGISEQVEDAAREFVEISGKVMKIIENQRKDMDIYGKS